MNLSTIIALLRNGLCCIKDLNLLSSSILYDPTYTSLFYTLPPPYMHQTTPLEVLIGVLQLYAFVALTLAGVQSMQRGLKLKRAVQRVEQRLPLQQLQKYATGYRIVKQRLQEDSAVASRGIVEGFWVTCIGLSFIWLFANSFHVTPTNLLGGVQGLMHALIVAEIGLLVTLYYMILDGWKKTTSARRIRKSVIPKLEKSGGRLGVITAVDFFDADVYAWIKNDGWTPYWNRSDVSAAEDEGMQLQQEIQQIQSSIGTLLTVEQDPQPKRKLLHAVTIASRRLTRQAWMLNVQGLMDYLSFVLNLVAFYGYLLSVLTFYLQDEEDAPEYWKTMKFGLKNADANWSGNFAGDLMWTIEPFTLLVAPYLFASMAPSWAGPSAKKVKSD